MTPLWREVDETWHSVALVFQIMVNYFNQVEILLHRLPLLSEIVVHDHNTTAPGLDWADGISTEQSHREQNRHYYLPFEKGRKGTLSSLTCFVISLHPSTLHNPLMPSPTSAVRRTSFTRVETVDFDGSWKAGDCRSPRWPTRPPYSRHAASNPVLGRQPDTFKSQVS